MDVQLTTEPSGKQLDIARALIERAERSDGRPPVSDQAMVAVAQGRRSLALFTDEGEARDPAALVAVGIVGEDELDLVVDPEHRGRGVGTAALSSLLDGGPSGASELKTWSHGPRRSEQSNALRAVSPDPALGIGAGTLKTWSHGNNPAADALLARAGFTPVRSLLLMQLDPSLLPVSDDPLAVSVPAGYTLRTFDPADPADSAAWVRVNAAAFASHPEQGRMTEADLASLRDESWFDPADLIMLEGPDGLAGSTWVKTVRAFGAETETELYAIGVDPEHAGKGLGKVLLRATLVRMAQHKPGKVTLYVDGDNDRAIGMYESAGFTVASRSRQWAKR